MKRFTIEGTVAYYGLVDNYNKTGKEYNLAITNWKHLEPETPTESELLAAWYPTARSLPKQMASMISTAPSDKLYFKSNYPVNEVYVIGTGGKPVKVSVEDAGINLRGATVRMVVYKSYIQPLLIVKNGSADNIPDFNGVEDYAPDKFVIPEPLENDPLPFN